MGPNPVNTVYEPATETGFDYEARIKALVEENEKLKVKMYRQRTELRRLNRRLSAMWEGIRFGAYSTQAVKEVIEQARVYAMRSSARDEKRDLAEVDAAEERNVGKEILEVGRS